MNVPTSTAELERYAFTAAWPRLAALALPRDERLHAHLLAVQALATVHLGETERGQSLADTAIAQAQGRWPTVEARARCARVEALVVRGHLGRADEEARTAYELLEAGAADWRALLELRMGQVAALHGQEEGVEQAAHGVDALVASGHGLASEGLLTLADLQPDEHHGHAMELRERATRIGSPADRARAHLVLAQEHLRTGRQGLARHHLAEGQALVPRADGALGEALALVEARTALLDDDRGRAIARLRRVAAPRGALRRCLAVSLALEGDLPGALALGLDADDPYDALLLDGLAAHDADRAPPALARAARRLRAAPRHDRDLATLYLALAGLPPRPWHGPTLEPPPESPLPPALAHAAARIAHRLAPPADRTELADGVRAHAHEHDLVSVGDWQLRGRRARHLTAGTQATFVHRTDGHPAALEAHELAARLERLAALEHPHLAGVLDHGRLDEVDAALVQGRPGQIWAVTRSAGGVGLGTLAGQVTWAEAQPILLQILTGLAHLHTHGVVHQGLSLDQVVVAQGAAGPRVRLRGLAEAPPSTPHSPEQLDRGDIGPWTDLAAVGWVAWQLVTGRGPFQGEGPDGLLAAWRAGPPPLEPTSPVPAGFEAWLRRLLDVDPSRRFPLAAEAAEALLRLGDPDASATPVPLGRRTHGPRRATEAPPTLPDAWPPDRAFEAPDGGRRHLPPLPPAPAPAAREALWQALADTLGSQRPRLVLLSGATPAVRRALVRWIGVQAEAVGVARTCHVEGTPGHRLRDRIADWLQIGRTRDADLPALLARRLPQVDGDQRQALQAVVRGGSHPAQSLAMATALRSQVPARPLVLGVACPIAYEPTAIGIARELLRRDAPVLVLLSHDRDRGTARDLVALEGHPSARRIEVDAHADGLFEVLGAAGSDLGGDAAWAADLYLSGDLGPGPGGWALQRTPAADPLAHWRRRLCEATATLPLAVRDALAAAFLPDGTCDGPRWDAVRRQLALDSDPLPVLVRAGLVVPEPLTWRLAHPALPGVLAELLRDSPQRGAVADAARRLARGRPPEHLAEVALLTGRPDAALGPLYQAAVQASRLGDVPRAVRQLEQYESALKGLGAPPTDRRWLASHLLRSQIALDDGATAEARARAQLALTLVPTASEDRARALDVLAAAADRGGELEVALQAWADAAKQWTGFGRGERARASALARAHALRRRGRVREANHVLDSLAAHPLVTLARGLLWATQGSVDAADATLAGLVAEIEGEDAARLLLCRAHLACRRRDLDAARQHIARARRHLESRPGALRTRLALAEAYISARHGDLVGASRMAEAALEHSGEPEARAWGLALRLVHGARQTHDALGALEAQLTTSGRCDPDLAWVLDRATDEATAALTVARLARLAGAQWRTLWQQSSG